MKLICQDIHRNYLLEKLKGYHHLDIVLVEKGIEYEGICYSFSIANLDQLISYLSELNDKHVVGYIDNKQYKIKPEDIVYIEGFSKEAYIQCFDKQYKTSLKLYELEVKVLDYGFVRINKSMIVNIKYIDYIIPHVQSRYIIILKNKEKLIVTRNYVIDFKQKWKERSL